MLVALSLSTQERIESLSFASGHDIRSKFPKGSLVCPFCQSPVFPRDRTGFLLHFVHKTQCTTTYGHHPESPEHLLGKKILSEALRIELQEYSDVSVFVEYPLPEAGKNGRIADVAAVFNTGYVLVYECQLAAITTENLSERTRDYASAGADVVWWLGGNANTKSNQDYCIAEFGACNIIRVDYSETDKR